MSYAATSTHQGCKLDWTKVSCLIYKRSQDSIICGGLSNLWLVLSLAQSGQGNLLHAFVGNGDHLGKQGREATDMSQSTTNATAVGVWAHAVRMLYCKSPQRGKAALVIRSDLCSVQGFKEDQCRHDYSGHTSTSQGGRAGVNIVDMASTWLLRLLLVLTRTCVTCSPPSSCRQKRSAYLADAGQPTRHHAHFQFGPYLAVMV